MAFSLATIGELVWDVYGARRHIGGSPANVALHAGLAGADVLLISRVGSDREGDELLTALAERQLPVIGIQRDRQKPTGQVHITLSKDGSPQYRCSNNVAFDYIQETDAWQGWAGDVNAIYFTARACRSEYSAAAVAGFLRSAPQALKFFDAGLSGWNDDIARIVEAGLNACDIFKANGSEMRLLLQHWGSREDVTAFAGFLLEHYHLQHVIVTNGVDGCLLISRDRILEQQSFPVAVVDTTGCGDAFSAAFLVHYLAGQKLDDIVTHANALAAFVATQEGAVPAWQPGDLESVMAARPRAAMTWSTE
jgi:fructokinase